MGLRLSPYQCTQGGKWMPEVAMGDPQDPQNVFCWDRVKLNLPGSVEYEPSEPWVLLQQKDGSLAAFVVLFVDALRVIAGSKEECWKGVCQVASIFNHLGVQNAPRKRQSSSQTLGV